MTSTVADFLTSGCGRCSLAATPQCKVIIHRELIEAIRTEILKMPFEETVKWGQLCYTANQKNAVLLSAVKGAAFVSFFRGYELKDPKGLLTAPGNESRFARVWKCANASNFQQDKMALVNFLSAAYQLEFESSNIQAPAADMSYPKSLEEVFASDPLYAAAFARLTPGQQRGYLIYFRQAKQENTCKRRIESSREKILKGEAR